MMDLTNKEVRDYIVDSLNYMLKTYNIEYVKWDYNRNVTESWSYALDAEHQTEFAHRYALGLYDLCERIVEANPNVFFEGCSAGGARFDPAMLHYFSQIWTSDDTDAEERTRIQYGTSIVYPLSAMSCHISDVPNHQTGRTVCMETRAAIAHLGPTGYELDASKFTDEDRVRVKAEVDEYKSISDLILNGDLYRVDNPYDTNRFTVCIISKDKSFGEMIAYRRIGSVNNAVVRVKAAGLDPDKKYFVPELDRTLSGSTLMNVGWTPKYPRGDFMCVKYHFIEK
jgi:alpha-galactosidase